MSGRLVALWHFASDYMRIMLSFLRRETGSNQAPKGNVGHVDRLLKRLFGRLGHKPVPLPFKTEELELLNKDVRPILLADSMLIDIHPPVKIVGDTHGQFYDLLRLFDFCGDPSTTRYLFLGDYVDRGQFALESMCLLFALKIKYPNSFWLLRGNHESSPVNQIYGFYDETRKRFGSKRGVEIWRDFCHSFNCLPMASLVGDRILCMHGGLSPDLKSLDQIRNLPRPIEIPDYGLVCDLVWADPDPDPRSEWSESERGASFTFGAGPVREACQRFGVDLIVRAHQMHKAGYRFYAGRRMLTLFSAPNYANGDNSAAVLAVDADFVCSFEIMRSDKKLPLIYVSSRAKTKKRKKSKRSITVTPGESDRQ